MNYGGRKISYNPDKYSRYSGVVTNINLNLNALNKKACAGLANKQLRDREESFSVYFMGANEERIKNLRKNEQLQKNMKNNRSNNKSSSIATRKNWEAYYHQRFQFQSKLNELGKNQEQLDNKSTAKPQELKSSGVDYNVISKMILVPVEQQAKPTIQMQNDKKNTAGSNKNIHILGKDSLDNIEDMIHNINSMNINLNQNLNKIGTPALESPLNAISNTKNILRRRNWGESKHGTIFPEYSSSVDNGPNRSGIAQNDNSIPKNNEKETSKNYDIDCDNFDNFDEDNEFNQLSSVSNTRKEGKGDPHEEKVDREYTVKDSPKDSPHLGPRSEIKSRTVVNNSIKIEDTEEKTNETVKGSIRHNTQINSHHNINEQLMLENVNKSSESLNISNNKSCDSFGNNVNSNINTLLIKKKEKNPAESNINSNINNNIKDMNMGYQKAKILNDIIVNKSRTKSESSAKGNERPFSSIVNFPKLKGSINERASDQLLSKIGIEGNMNANVNAIHQLLNLRGKTIISPNPNQPISPINYGHKINFDYKSPQNKTKGVRPVSHIQKAKSIISALASTSTGGESSNNTKCHFKSIGGNIIQAQLNNGLLNKGQISGMTLTTPGELSSNRASKQGQVKISGIELKNKTQYPTISNKNIPHVDIITNNNNNINTKNMSPNEVVQSTSNFNQTSQEGLSVDKKYELITKIKKMDDNKVKRIMKMVEELAGSIDERSDLQRIHGVSDNDIRKCLNDKHIPAKENVNINYIKTDSINFGSININVNNNNNNNNNTNNITLSANSSPSSFREIKKDNHQPGNQDLLCYEEEFSPAFNTKKLIPSFLNNSSGNSISNYSVISISILSTWGNLEKVGITEVQIFDSKFKKIDIIECHVFNGTEDGINKIFNNKTHTINDNDMWVSNFSSNIKIEIYFEAIYDIESMMIWNYNGRDISKGVKQVEVYKRNMLSWKGIINKGCFNIKNDFSTRIKFRDEITPVGMQSLTKKNTNEFASPFNDSLDMNTPTATATVTGSNINKITVNRRTSVEQKIGEKIERRICEKDETRRVSSPILNILNSARDTLHMNITENENENDMGYEAKVIATSGNTGYEGLSSNYNCNCNCNLIPTDSLHPTSMNISHRISCNKIKLVMLSNYGDHKYVGLTGIQFIDEKNEPVNIENALSIGALPKDVNTYYNNCGDPRIFENVFNNINEVIDDSCMWLTILKQGKMQPYLEIVFPQPITLAMIKIWNYNKPGELDRGVRTLELIIEDSTASDKIIPTLTYQKKVVLRKGIGEENVDYCQNITFPIQQITFSPEELEPFNQIKCASFLYSQDFETPYLPTGFVFKFVLYSTWGDTSLIGLNGIEFFDQLGYSIFQKTTPTVIAIPSQISEPHGAEDARNVYNLLGSTSGNERKIWLVPYVNTRKAESSSTDDVATSKSLAIENTFSNFRIAPAGANIKPNSIFFIFDRPVCLSYIKFWNYTNVPEMGVKDIQLFCDDQIIYAGTLHKADRLLPQQCSNTSRGSVPANKNSPQLNCTIILFTCDSQITKNIDETALTNGNVKNKYKYQEKASTSISLKEEVYKSK